MNTDSKSVAVMRDLSPVVFRGESDGSLKAEGGLLYPYFFTERYDQARLYAGPTEPLACVIQGSSFLDMTAPDWQNPLIQKLITDFAAEFDDWTCRYSGEQRDAMSYIESGDLYDYEGTGEATRWNTFIRFALDEFDAVRLLDCTDGTHNQPVPIWVTRNRDSIRMAGLGEKLTPMLEQRAWPEVRNWLEREEPDLLERIKRLSFIDPGDELKHMTRYLPPVNQLAAAYQGGPVTVWRAGPAGGEIRPGDLVDLDRDYAAQHAAANGVELHALELVQPSDVRWPGTDENEFIYLPAAWRIQAESCEDYLRRLGPERLRMLCDGEKSAAARMKPALDRLQHHILSTFDSAALGEYHGFDHWQRVGLHGCAVARSLGIDPLIPHIFALVHDSQRWDEGVDPNHGRRAADFIASTREDLFGFLSDDQVRLLAKACEVHSDGTVERELVLQACLDADRLDLWRVGIEPSPGLLATALAKSPQTIDFSHQLWSGWDHLRPSPSVHPPKPRRRLAPR